MFVKNDLTVESTIHWHGLLQRGTPQMDGVPGVTQFPIAPGGNFTYRFSVQNEYGFYWYHSHFRAYYNDAIRGPLMIRPSSSRRRPFESLATSPAELDALLQAELDSTSVLLNDWTHTLSDVIYAQYFETGVFPSCVVSLLANGQGRVQCLPESVLQAGSFPTESCTSTTSDLMMIPANTTQGWLALDFINAGSVSNLGESLDAHSMYVYASDGLYVTVQEVKVLYLALGQRYSVMISLI